MTRGLFVLAVALPFAACDSSKTNRMSSVSVDSLRSEVGVAVRTASDEDDARRRSEKVIAESERSSNERRRCDAASNLPESIDLIVEKPKDYVGDDSCAAVLADALVERFVRSDEKKYLEALDILSRAADSKSTELLGAAVLDLFRARPVELIRHLYRMQGDPTATEVDALLITEIQLGRDDAFNSEIHGILDRLESGDDLSTDEKRFLSRLESQFWAAAN